MRQPLGWCMTGSSRARYLQKLSFMSCKTWEEQVQVPLGEEAVGLGLRHNIRDWLAGGRSIEEAGAKVQWGAHAGGACNSLLEEELLKFRQWRHTMGPLMSWCMSGEDQLVWGASRVSAC